MSRLSLVEVKAEGINPIYCLKRDDGVIVRSLDSEFEARQFCREWNHEMVERNGE